MGTGRKVAVVGFWEGNRNDAPFQNPEFEIWGLNHLHPWIPRWDVWFDMHTPEWSAKGLKPEVWADQDGWLKKDHGKPIYMLKRYEAYPDSIPYPLEAVGGRFRKYFTNGIAYMLGLALYEHVNGKPIERLEVWGVDMRHEEEYALQRPCAEYWLGRAEGLGIDVFIPPTSVICSADFLYGYEEQGGIVSEAIREHEKVVRTCEAKIEEALKLAQTLDGMRQDNQEWLRRWKQKARGGGLL